MPSPASVRSGYEARVERSSSYNVELAKWASGTRTVLGSVTRPSIPIASSVALSEDGGGLTVWLRTGSTFTPLLLANDGAYTSGYAGLEVYGADGTINNFRAGSLRTPPKPTIKAVSPASPANNNKPLISGAAEAGTTVQLYTNSVCTGVPLATGTAAAFASPGITASVADNTTTTFYAAAANGTATSACSSASSSYKEDSTAPTAPKLSTTNPPSPANNNLPAVIGSAEAGSTVRLYRNGICSGSQATSGSATTLTSPGIALSVTGDVATAISATAVDAAGNTSACSSSLSYVEDSKLPTLSFSSEFNAANPTNYTLHIHAADAGSSASGIKTVSLLLNGEALTPIEETCAGTQCPTSVEHTWSYKFSHPLDGSDYFTVIATDKAANSGSATFDLPSEVVQATIYTGDPSQGGKQVAQEWVQLHTHNARREAPNGTQTRGTADCPEGIGAKRCTFLRGLGSEAEASSSQGRYSEALAPLADATSLAEAGTLLLPSQPDFGDTVGSGLTSAVRQPWQALPPGAGETFEEVLSSNGATAEDKAGTWRFWIDSRTKLPIKAVLQDGNEPAQITYYSYRSTPEEAGGLSPAFFMLTPPTQKSGSSCLPSGKLGGWQFSSKGFVYPNPSYGSLVAGANGLVEVDPEGAAGDGYEPRTQLTSSGVIVTSNVADQAPLKWEVNEDPEQILETSGNTVIVETPGGTPSAVIASTAPQLMKVVDGTPNLNANESQDRLILESSSGVLGNASIQKVAGPSPTVLPCITKSNTAEAAVIHEEFEEERAVAFGTKPTGNAQTTPVVVWINPHPALAGVSVTDKYGVCNAPHTKTFGSDGRLEFGGCPTGKSVTLIVPQGVSAGGVNYTVPDPSRTFNPPSGGWTVFFNYAAAAGSPPPPPSPPVFTPPSPDVLVDPTGEASISTTELPIPERGKSCRAAVTRPYKTVYDGDWFAEVNMRVRCRPEAVVTSWVMHWKLLRFNEEEGLWKLRKERLVGKIAPSYLTEGPFYIWDECQSLGNLLNQVKKKWEIHNHFVVLAETGVGKFDRDAAKSLYCG